MYNIKAGSLVRFKSLKDVRDTSRTQGFGWHPNMQSIVDKLASYVFKVTGAVNGRIHFDDDGNWMWHVSSFELHDYQVGDRVIRTRRFTPSFVEGEVHEIQRVSSCGTYIWVGGHRHKVPVKYFKKLIKPVDPSSSTAHVLTEFDEYVPAKPVFDAGRVAGDNPHGCGLVANTEVQKPCEFKVGDIITHKNHKHKLEVGEVSLDGAFFKAVGSRHLGWLPIAEYLKVSDVKPLSSLIDRDIVAGLVNKGMKVQYHNMGEWLDVNPDSMTIAMINRLDFRLKPLEMDFYGITIPAPIDVDLTQNKTVYGVSINNNKVYPCSISTARVNQSKGYGLYWETEGNAKLVLETLTKPFKGAAV